MEIVLAKEVKDSTQASSDILKSAELAEVQAYEQLYAHLRSMLNKPAFSDVVFLCNDGKRVQALRKLLAGRSDVLKGMLINGMAESNLSEIELPEFSSPVLLSVLEFLYTGSLLDYRPKSWTNACKILKASRFFLLPFLEAIVRKFMYAKTCTVAQDLAKSAVLLTVALGFKDLWDENDSNLRELVKILSSDWSDSDYVKCLSEDAFHYVLANSKSNGEDVDKLSFSEYLRFRQVIRWWILQSDFGPSATEELVDFAVPDDQAALAVCMHPDNFENISSPEDDSRISNDWHSFQADEESRNSVIRLMSNIDCRWIHPALLAKVVEPLKIVSSAEMVSAFRFHALRRPMIFKNGEFGWQYYEGSYRTLEQGSVIQRTGTTTGPAVLLAAMSRSVGVYHWRFVVEKLPEDYCELGFVYDVGGLEADRPTTRLCDQHCARVLDFRVKGAWINWAGPGGPETWTKLPQSLHKNSRAEFVFNAHDHTCSITLDGEDCGIVWKDLPSAIYYPAVSFGQSAKGQVRVEFVNGFDIL